MIKIKKSKMCKECGKDPTERMSGGLYKKNLLHRKMAKEYCIEQEAFYSNQKLKPIWEKCCGALDYYLVTLTPKTWQERYKKSGSKLRI